MGINTREKIQSGEVKIHKRSCALIPLKRSPSSEGIDRSPNPNRSSGSGDGSVESTPIKNAGDLFYLGDSEFNGADFFINQLAIGCLYLLAKKATLNWPTTSAAHPSAEVQVARTTARPYTNSHETIFPFFVNGRMWHEAIVPVLEDPGFNLRRPKNRCIVDRDLDQYLTNLRYAIADSLRSKGYIP